MRPFSARRQSNRLRTNLFFVVFTGAFVLSCSGGGSSDSSPTSPSKPSTPAAPVVTAISVAGGGGQTARIGSAITTPPSVIVRDQFGAAMVGVVVNFSISGGGGSLSANTGTTDATGTAVAGVWTLGKSPGANTLTAQAVGGANPSAAITATSRLPYWTVMIYMAADNSLAYFGALNLQQMANAGVNPEVQVVVQAEFNPAAFAQNGLTPAIVDRPNYNTFRYVMDGSVSRPPNNVLIGPATDIGNVNMTDPATLRSFVQWAESAAPSQHTVLVLWNHGGDQTGLIQDLTSAGSSAMSLPQLTTALTGLPQFDVIYFEMCLMGGYEPLSAVRGLTQTAVASEDEEYVAGWNFTTFLQTMYANTTSPATTVASALATAFDGGYVGLGLSETVSAYNMSGLPAVDAALGQLATALNASSTATPAAVASATSRVQRYGYAWVADLVDVADTLRVHFSDPAIVAAANSVRQAITSSSFLLANYQRTGTQLYQRNEARSRGLTIVMPSTAPYALPSTGPAGLATYQQQFSASPWTPFLTRYVAGVASQPFVNVGVNQLTVWQIWNPSVVGKSWIEMLLLEPDGTLSGPALGSISPSGVFSADAVVTNTYYEGWGSWPIVENGRFYFLAWLVTDAANQKPLINVAYQQGTGAATSLYGPGTANPNYPQLSLATSFRNDANALASNSVMQNAIAGLYTDLKVVALWNTAPSSASSAQLLARAPALSSGPIESAPRITAAQLETLQRLVRDGRIAPSGITAPDLRVISSLQRFAPR